MVRYRLYSNWLGLFRKAALCELLSGVISGGQAAGEAAAADRPPLFPAGSIHPACGGARGGVI